MEKEVSLKCGNAKILISETSVKTTMHDGEVIETKYIFTVGDLAQEKYLSIILERYDLKQLIKAIQYIFWKRVIAMPSSDLEHPNIQRIRKYGYSEPEKPAPKDYFGDPISPGDPIVRFDDEVILEENLRRYLEEVWGAEFTIAE